MKRYADCERTDGLCGICSLSSYGNDCRGKEMNRILYYRSIQGLTQAEVSEKSGMNIRQLRRYESDEMDVGNMTLKNAVLLSSVFGCEPKDLL